MLFLLKLNPEYSSKLLVEAKGTCALVLFLLSAKKKAFIVSFRWDTKILTADRTAGSAAVCKAVIDHEFRHHIVKVAVDPRGNSRVDPQTTLTML